MTNPWRFAGGYFDSSTGLYKYGTRYYNPGFGRWSQQDPLRGQLKDPTSLNRYVYAGDDPVNFTDPSGKDVMDCIKDMILAAAANLAFLFTLIGVNIQETMAWAALYAALDDATATAATIALAEAGVAAVAAFAWWIIGAVLVIALAALVVMYLSCRAYM